MVYIWLFTHLKEHLMYPSIDAIVYKCHMPCQVLLQCGSDASMYWHKPSVYFQPEGDVFLSRSGSSPSPVVMFKTISVHLTASYLFDPIDHFIDHPRWPSESSVGDFHLTWRFRLLPTWIIITCLKFPILATPLISRCDWRDIYKRMFVIFQIIKYIAN